MERDPRDRFDDLEELRFGDEPDGEPRPEPDEWTTFDRSRFDVFDSDPDIEPELVFTPEPGPLPDADHTSALEAATSEDLIPDEIDLTPPDWWISTPTPEPLEDTPFELLSLDVFDEDDDDLG